MKEMQTDDFEPPESNQRICRILGSRGNNLHEVESAEPFAGTSSETIPPLAGAANTTTENANDGGCQFLVSMPTKFRKNVWVKRGDFVIAEPIDEGDKVKAEIVRILTAQHIKEFKKMSIWPEKFTSKDNRAKQADPVGGADDKNDSDNDSDLFVNTNRAHHAADDESSSDSDSIENSDSDASDADSGEFNVHCAISNSIRSFEMLEFILQRTMQATLKKMKQMERTTRVKNRFVNSQEENVF